MLFMDDALNGITSPQDYIYIKILRLTLKSVGFWPGFILGEKTWKCAPYYGLFPLITNASVFVSGIAFVVAYGDNYDFLHIGHIYITVLMGALITFRSYALPMNTKIQNIILRFMTSIHLFYHANKSEYARHNVRGLKTKLTIWRSNLSLTEHDVVAVTETFLDSSVEDLELSNGDWTFLRRDRGATGGGVLLATRLSVNMKRRRELETDNGEDMWVTLSAYGMNINICVIYMKPSATDDDYMTWFCKVESFITDLKGIVLILGDLNLKSASVHVKIHKICHLAAVILFVQMLIGLSFFCIIPMYSNYSQGKLNYEVLVNSTFDLAVYLYYPADATTNRRSYYVMTIINWYEAYICAVIICMCDLLLFLMVFHIYGHFQILLNLLATMPRPAAVEVENSADIKLVDSLMYSEKESVEVTKTLKQCIDYHRFLLDFTDSMSKGFGPILLTYFVFHQFACCLLLLECSQMTAEALIGYGPLTMTAFQGLIQTCVIFETIGIVSEKLSDQVYAIPWECMDIENRKIVLFFLMNVQTPVHVKAMGFTDVGVTTMATILKTSISYFAFLRTVPE